ncbi:hypothetical protein [Veillonella ratti]|uniref:hypothetical protein n=1 Tax=Veillonella ratti TaxID=103892 RepID=UPI000F8CC65C|nr:hypothetical protein [Veillonella ratti]
MKQLRRISLAVLISSALTGGVFANGTADLVMDPADTWAPEKAAVNKMAVRLAESIEAQESEKTGIDLTAIGKSYTADSLEALSEKDFAIGKLILGADFRILTGKDSDWEALLGGPLSDRDAAAGDKTATATKAATDTADTTKGAEANEAAKADAAKGDDKDGDTKGAAEDAKADAANTANTANTTNAVKTDSTDAGKGTDDAVKDAGEIKLLADDAKKSKKIRPAKPEVKPITVKDMFTTYTGKDGSFTVYTGVYGPNSGTLNGHLGDGDTLRREGLDYTFAPQTITNIHITEGTAETVRDIGIGKTRGTILFAYGAPQGMWRDAKTGTVALIYKYEKSKNSVKSKKEFASPVAKDNDNREGTPLTTNGINAPSSQYLVFTLKNNKVSAIDMIDGQVWSRLKLPAVQEQYYKANQLTADDFSLMGYRVNEPFVSNQDEQWQQRGFLYDDEFIAYDDVLVGYDKNQMVVRAMITKSTALTRRGISIGDSKYLLLYLYGMPTSVETDTAANGDPLMIYTYKNPDSAYSYLLFTVGEKDNFIKTVMLSDRPNKELSK